MRAFLLTFASVTGLALSLTPASGLLVVAEITVPALQPQDLSNILNSPQESDLQVYCASGDICFRERSGYIEKINWWYSAETVEAAMWQMNSGTPWLVYAWDCANVPTDCTFVKGEDYYDPFYWNMYSDKSDSDDGYLSFLVKYDSL